MPGPEAFALDKMIGISAGYDSNVNAAPEASGSPFTACHFNLTHQMLHEKAYGKSVLYFNSYYKNYVRFDNNFSVNAGGYYSCFPGGKRLRALGLMEAGIYRDDEDAFDEVDYMKTGGRLEYFYSPRATFHFLQFFNWNRYLEPVGTITGNGSGFGLEKRKDFYLSSDIGITLRLHPACDMKISALYNRLLSNIKTESYDGPGSFIMIRFFPDALWEISAEAALCRKDFDTIENRTDVFRSAGIVFNLFLKPYELFVRADFVENDSNFEYETYNRSAVQCGVSIRF